MATLTVNIPDAILTRVINGIAYDHGYLEVIENADGTSKPNPLAKTQFAKQVVINFIKKSVKSYESNKAVEIAKEAAESLVEAEVNLS